MPIKMYFKGGAGIENPVDVEGNPIKVGDILTHCWFGGDYVAFFRDYISKSISLEEIERRVNKPNAVVKYDEEGQFFYGEGLVTISDFSDSRSYIHDFMFRFTKIVKQ
jgi:hypothetical protein